MFGNIGPQYMGRAALEYLSAVPESFGRAFSKKGVLNKADALFMGERNPMAVEVYRKSGVLQARVQSLAREHLNRSAIAEESSAVVRGAKRGVRVFKDLGMRGQEFSDGVAVTIGWKAAYFQSLDRQARVSGVVDEKRAIMDADKVINMTQPDVRDKALPDAAREGGAGPLFRLGTGLLKVWDLYARIPGRFRREGLGAGMRYTLGLVTAQMICGLVIGAIRGQLKGLFSDKEKERDGAVKRAVYLAAVEPFTSAVPIPMVAAGVSRLGEELVTGKGVWAPNADVFPLFNALIQFGSDLAAGKKGDGFIRNLVNVGGYATGLPATQVNRIMRAVAEGDGFADTAARVAGLNAR
jgi:hypothetical protein